MKGERQEVIELNSAIPRPSVDEQTPTRSAVPDPTGCSIPGPSTSHRPLARKDHGEASLDTLGSRQMAKESSTVAADDMRATIRKRKNVESALRSRARKTMETNALYDLVDQHSETITALQNRLNAVVQEFLQLEKSSGRVLLQAEDNSDQRLSHGQPLGQTEGLLDQEIGAENPDMHFVSDQGNIPLSFPPPG